MNLTTGNIGKHLRTIAVPASIGMIFSTLYNITDTFFAGMYGPEALAALAVTFPLFFAILSIGAGLTQGTNALISNNLGEKNTKKANFVARQAIGIAVLLSIPLAIIGIAIAPAAFRLLGLTETTIPIAIGYINIMFIGVGLFLLAFVTNSPLLARGDTKSIRNVFAIGFFLNIILNPLFMFTFGFGVPGIALATITIYIFNATYYILKGRKAGVYAGATFKDFIPTKTVSKEIFVQALPAGMNMLTMAFGAIILTFFFGRFGEAALAAFSVAMRIDQIVILPLVGLNMAVMSVVGQNNGAKKTARVRETYNVAIRYGLYVMTLGSVALFFGGSYALKLFTDDPQILSIGTYFIRIIALSTWTHALLFVSQSFFQGIKRPWITFSVGASRMILFPLILFPLALFLFGTLESVIWTMFIINWIFALLFLTAARIMLRRITHKST